MTKIAINGFGRIGRLLFRKIWEEKDIEVVAVNDLGDLENLAYLLKYDSAFGRFDKKVETGNGSLWVEGKEVKVLQEKDPINLPWGKMGIDIVVESTGFFESFEKAKAHVDAGAKRVIISAPAKDMDGLGKTILVGVNGEDIQLSKITSNASCTTNAASPVIQVLSENPGIEKAILNTVHAYTATQNLVDGPTKGSDFRRGRAAAQNIVPSTTGAALAVTRAIKGMEGKFDGIALRVPVVSGSVADITFVSKRKVTVEEINEILTKASKDPKWEGIMKVSEDQLVSSDIVGEPYGAIVDLQFTKVVDGDLVKVMAWYDNEAGYVSTLIKHIKLVKNFL